MGGRLREIQRWEFGIPKTFSKICLYKRDLKVGVWNM